LQSCDSDDEFSWRAGSEKQNGARWRKVRTVLVKKGISRKSQHYVGRDPYVIKRHFSTELKVLSAIVPPR